MGVLLALISSLTWGVADFMGGLASRKAGPVHVLSVSYPAGAVVLTAIAILVIPGQLSTEVLIWGASAGVVGAVAMEALVDKLRGSLWGSLAGDSLAMPVHW